MRRNFTNVVISIAALVAASLLFPITTHAQQKPNILVIMADDVGWYNTSCYNSGMLGYRTPNIDRISAEGARFTDWYGQQSCTAGRAAFITGQSPIRTGLTRVGMPGMDFGLRAEDITVAEVMKNLGYATGHFGKNHVGDRNEFLPTVHGFDEFFGSLYHLNAEEEPENADYPKDPGFRQRFGPRGVLKCKATDTDDPTVDPQYGRVGKQAIENTGPLNVERMKKIDEDFTAAALDFIDRKSAEGKPWLCYFNPTRVHIWTHLKKESEGKTGLGMYADAMVELDGFVGQMLKKLDDLKLTENTIVVFTTDNGAQICTWPDGGNTPFRGEKATCWEGGFRVPTLIRWPGTVKPGTVVNDVCAHEDLIPTFAAAAGETDLVAKVAKGYEAAGKSFKVHLDGYNLLPYLKGEAPAGPRNEFLYWTDDGDLAAIRLNRWKMTFLEQEHKGFDVWNREYTRLRVPNIYDMRMDPFERGTESFLYSKWQTEHLFLQVPLQGYVMNWVQSFKDYPVRQKLTSSNLEDVIARLTAVPPMAR
ncbi:MAG: arylsulfatase [Candidatus Hydrogenedentes bacterium]|nr:arylsulfatase [Candidatus Hydrogenedentota bacterium]